MKQIIKWTVLGSIGGWAGLAMFYSGILALKTYMVLGMFPPDLIGIMELGAVVGAFVGCYKAGYRLRVYKKCADSFEDDPLYDEDLYG